MLINASVEKISIVEPICYASWWAVIRVHALMLVGMDWRTAPPLQFCTLLTQAPLLLPHLPPGPAKKKRLCHKRYIRKSLKLIIKIVLLFLSDFLRQARSGKELRQNFITSGIRRKLSLFRTIFWQSYFFQTDKHTYVPKVFKHCSDRILYPDAEGRIPVGRS